MKQATNYQMQTIDNILSEVKTLNKEEQLNLLERLVAIIRKEQSPHNMKLSSISGLGSEIWQGEDIDKYIEKEREW